MSPEEDRRVLAGPGLGAEEMRVSVNTFWYRVPLLGILAWIAVRGHERLDPYSPLRTEGWIVFWGLGGLAVLILLPELVQLTRSGVRPLAKGIARWANRQAAKLRHTSDARPWAWLLARSSLGLLMLARVVWIYGVRFLALPVRTYYNPTVTAVVSTALVHWFLVAGVVFGLEAQSNPDDGPLAGEGLIYTLWRMAVFFTNQSLDDEPLSFEARVVALAGLVVFLLMMTAYAASFREERERRIHRRLRNKPRFLPMQDHSLVVGDLFSIRLILQQFEHYGRNQDIVVAGLDPATATVAGLDRLEPMVWAVEGNLWEREVRRQAKVERAAELVVAAANLKRGEAWRTVAAVEGDRPCVVTVVDAREEDDRIIEKVLSKHGGDPDLNLRWDRRRAGFRATCREIPGFAELIRDLVSFHPRSVFPRSFNLSRHVLLSRPQHWPRLGRFRDRFLPFYTRCFNVVPLWPGPVDDEVGHLHRLCASGEQAYLLLPVHWLPRFGRWLWRFLRRLLWLRVAEKPPRRDDGPAWRASTADFETAVEPAEKRLAAEPDAATAAPPAEEHPAADDDADDEAAAGEPQARAVFPRTRLEEDRRLLDKLVEECVWVNSPNGRRRLVEFNYPESAAALSTICERNDADGRVETYSDLEMRSLWLSMLAICGESALELLDALWPARSSEEPRLVFELALVDTDLLDGRDSIGFGRAVRRCLESGTSLLAYRSPGGKWIPCAYGHRLHPGDQLLRLRRTDPHRLWASGGP